MKLLDSLKETFPIFDKAFSCVYLGYSLNFSVYSNYLDIELNPIKHTKLKISILYDENTNHEIGSKPFQELKIDIPGSIFHYEMLYDSYDTDVFNFIELEKIICKFLLDKIANLNILQQHHSIITIQDDIINNIYVDLEGGIVNIKGNKIIVDHRGPEDIGYFIYNFLPFIEEEIHHHKSNTLRINHRYFS